MAQLDSKEDNKVLETLKSLNEFAFSTFTVTLFRFGIRVVKNVVFTRILGPMERGVFGLLTTIPEIIISFGNMGFGLGNTYLVAKHRYALNKIVGNTLLVTLLLGFFLMGAGYIVFSYKGILKDNTAIVNIYAPMVIFLLPFVLLEKFGSDLLIATKQIHFMNLLRLVLSGLPVVLIVVLWILTGNSLYSAMYAWATTILVVSLCSIAKVISNNATPLKISPPYIKEAFSYGSRGFVSIFSDQITRRIDFLFISTISGAEALGYYAVSVSIAEILLAVPDAFSKPFLALHFSLDDKDAKSFAPLVIRMVLFIMTLLCLSIVMGGNLVITVLFGKAFLPAYSSMLLLLPGIIALSIYQLLRVDMYSRNLPGFVSLNSIFAMICNVILNFLLIPRYGISGAAISSSISYGLATFILFMKFIRLSKLPFREVLIIKVSDIKIIWSMLRGK